MSDSDRDAPTFWSGGERRAAERRKAKERRGTAASKPAGEDRRRGERRSGDERRDESAWQPVALDVTLASFDPAEGLIAAALDARGRARAPYSQFPVGAALETAAGRLITGCNIENASYSLTICAERVALVKALSDGHDVFTRIAVVADTSDLTPPCGPCRQLLWEYCGDMEVILANLSGATAKYRLSSLLPLPFDRRLLRTP